MLILLSHDIGLANRRQKRSRFQRKYSLPNHVALAADRADDGRLAGVGRAAFAVLRPHVRVAILLLGADVDSRQPRQSRPTNLLAFSSFIPCNAL